MTDLNKALYEKGKLDALDTQKKSSSLNGTELNALSNTIPEFNEIIKNSNILNRSIGFICKSPSERIVKLLQPYDSNIYTQEPEELSAQWGFVWSKNPEDALPFISIATSPYMKDEVCSFEGKVYKATIDNLVHSPKDFPSGWKEVI